MGAGYPASGGGIGKLSDVEGLTNLAELFKKFITRSTALWKMGKPIAEESSAQKLEALKTGGVGAQIPMIQRAVESSKAATASALKSTVDQGAATGLGGTPFLAQILAGTRMSGAQATSQIPTRMASDIINSPTAGLDAITASLQEAGMGRAFGAMDLQRQEFNISNFAKFMEDIKSSMQSIGESGASSG